jgi:pyruvate ferredoxin oxidoreductase alpha subunit
MSTNLTTLSDTAVRRFVGRAKPMHPLTDFAQPTSYGLHAGPNYYYEIRRSQEEALANTEKSLQQIGKRYQTLTGRSYAKPYSELYLRDAETVFVTLGASSGATEVAVRAARARGERVGLLRLHLFRPFPAATLARVLARAKCVLALDRTMPAGSSLPPLASELTAALAGSTTRVKSYVYGIGGRQYTPASAESALAASRRSHTDRITYLDLRA